MLFIEQNERYMEYGLKYTADLIAGKVIFGYGTNYKDRHFQLIGGAWQLLCAFVPDKKCRLRRHFLTVPKIKCIKWN